MDKADQIESNPCVVLFRAPKHDDAYEEAFRREGWDVCSIPVLTFEQKNEQLLRSHLHDSDSFAGIIVTSPRAGDILGDAFQKDNDLQERWQGKPILCIGNRSATNLAGYGLTLIMSSLATSKSLAASVVNQQVRGTWLFLCGNLRREELPGILTEASVPFVELQVYETLLDSNIELSTLKEPGWVVFFSPSGVEAVGKNWPRGWQRTKKAAIGPTTAQAMTDAGWRAAAIAAYPDPESLIIAVMRNATDKTDRLRS